MASKFRQRYRARMDRQRGIFITANRPRLFASPARFNPLPPITRTILQQLEDRREWHPEGYARPARGWSLPRHRLVMRQSKGEARRSSSFSFQSPFLPSFQSVPIGIGFKAPKQVAICIRRKIRKEVILATGKGGARHRKPTRSYYSEVFC